MFSWIRIYLTRYLVVKQLFYKIQVSSCIIILSYFKINPCDLLSTITNIYESINMMLDYWYPYSLLLFMAVAGKVQISSHDADEKIVATDAPCDEHNNRALADRLRDRMVRLTHERSKTVAALLIAQQREHTLALLEREKYE